MAIMQASIKALLTRHGRSMTLGRGSGQSYTAGTGLTGTLTTTSHTVTAAIVNYSDKHRENTLIHQNDRKALIAAKGMTVDPLATDTLTDGGIVYNIVSVQKIVDASVKVAFICQLRT